MLCPDTSRGRHLRRLACLRSHALCVYCNFESKQVISITLFARRPNNNKILNSTLLATNEAPLVPEICDQACFLDNVTSLAAEFNTYLRRWILYLGRPYKSALQLSNLEVTKACTSLSGFHTEERSTV